MGPEPMPVVLDALAIPRPQSATRWDAAMDGALKILLTISLLVELVVVFCSIISRSVFNSPWIWTDEVARLALSTIAFAGGAFAYRRGEHACLHTLIDALPVPAQRVCQVLVQFLVLTVAVAAGLNAYPLLIAKWLEVTTVLQMRAIWYVLPLLVCMLVLALTALQRLASLHRRTVLVVGGGFVVLVAALSLTQEIWLPWVEGDGALGLALGMFFLPVFIGLPVGFALLLGALAYLFASGAAPMVALAHTMVSGVSNFVLLALPFFILAGMVMNSGGISRRLVQMVHALVGHFRAGLFYVMVVSMYIVSGLSGSKVADVAAVGLVMRDMLRRQGYDMEQSTAVLAASAVMGETVPPSIPMLVLASVTTLSTGALFIAGLVPAVVIGICLMGLIYVQARRSAAPSPPRADRGQITRATLGGLLPLLMPVFLFGGILFGVGTPTEVSSFAVVYGLVLACLIYRELGWRAFLKGVIDCAAASGMILFILSTASSFAWALTTAHLPDRLVELLTGAHQSQWVFMLASILLLIVTGSVLEGLPALLILAPILMPIAGQIGVNELHYGIVLVIAMGIGTFMPPIGACFYITCAVCETTIEGAGRRMVPFLVVLVLGLVVVALVPWFTLFLPMKFHLAG
jgi:tripartite ATP-independent transporter DctM subunit